MLGALIASVALAAVEPSLAVEPLGPVRPGGLLRVAVRTQETPAAAVTVELRDDDAVLAEAAASLPAGGGRAILVLVPAALGSGRLHLRAVATWPKAGMSPGVLAAEAPVATPAATMQAANEAVARLRASGIIDALPWLWAEEIAELGAGGASSASIGEVAVLAARIDGWLAGKTPAMPRPGLVEAAVRDAVDGSVQPLRLHLPVGSGPHPVMLLLTPAAPGLGKARWPHAEPRLVDAALAAGVAVVECYAAGDRAWNGAARRRLAPTLAVAAQLGPLDLTRGACVGGNTDDAGLPYALHRPPVAADAAWCRSILAAPRAIVPGDGWADAPFAVVVGSAEHAAAIAANRRLAESFRAAYADHAHAVVELLDDRCDPARLAGRNLVLIGNPRSNRVLAGLQLDLPWTWDHREVVGRDGTRQLRAVMPALLCRTRLGDGRAVLILDGQPPAWGEGLPVAGVP